MPEEKAEQAQQSEQTPVNETAPEAASEATPEASAEQAAEAPAAEVKAETKAPAAKKSTIKPGELVGVIESLYLKKEIPQLNPGDTVKVMVKIKEGNKERIQGYEGVVIKLAGSGISKTVTVRRVFQGVGVERVFLLHSPKVDDIKIIRRGSVRRSKLYYLRERTGKAARIKEKTSIR